MSNEEITYEQVLEYCKKRNLDLVDHAFLVRLYNNGKAIPVEWFIDKEKKIFSKSEMTRFDWQMVEVIDKLLDDYWEAENGKAD